MRVLVSRLSSLGDVVCTLPVACAIKSEWPDSEVVWIVDRRFRGVLECCRAVDTIVERPRSPLEVRGLGAFDAGLDMQGLLKSALLVGLALPYRARTAGALATLLAYTVVALAPPYLAKLAIDQGISENDIGRLSFLVALFLVAALAALVLSSANTYLTGWVGERMLADLRNRYDTDQLSTLTTRA